MQGYDIRRLMLLRAEPFEGRSDFLDFVGESHENSFRIVQFLTPPEHLKPQSEIERVRGGERGYRTFQGMCGPLYRSRVLAFDCISNC